MRADRLLGEANASGGPLRLCRLFGIRDPTAIRCWAETGLRGYDVHLALEGAAGSAGRTESTSASTWQAVADDALFRPGRGPPGDQGDVTPDLPARPDFDQLRHQARDLLRAARRGDPEATARIRSVAGRIILSSAQLALAREYGFVSWARLKLEVERRDVLNGRDLSRLTTLLAEHPELATAKMEHWCDHQLGADPLSYMAMLRSTATGSGCHPSCPAPATSPNP